MTKTCRINNEECSATPRLTRGLCDTHYKRLMKYGDPLTVFPNGRDFPRGEAHPDWVGDDISVRGMHRRLDAARGKASSFECADGCGRQAYEWSYDGLDPGELVESGQRYSLKPDHYQSRCRPCHRRYDIGGEKNVNAKLTWERVEEIRALAYVGVKQVTLAEMYDTTQPNISEIVLCKSWIPEPVCTEAREIAEVQAA